MLPATMAQQNSDDRCDNGDDQVENLLCVFLRVIGGVSRKRDSRISQRAKQQKYDSAEAHAQALRDGMAGGSPQEHSTAFFVIHNLMLNTEIWKRMDCMKSFYSTPGWDLSGSPNHIHIRRKQPHHDRRCVLIQRPGLPVQAPAQQWSGRGTCPYHARKWREASSIFAREGSLRLILQKLSKDQRLAAPVCKNHDSKGGIVQYARCGLAGAHPCLSTQSGRMRKLHR